MVIKTHLQSNDSDTNLFIDVGLSILGQDWNIYSKYYKKIIFNLYRQREFPRKKKILRTCPKTSRCGTHTKI
ncbi:hypothetical protein F1631_22030 [Leptospira interrogans serovar Yeoncheon]|nr:hypothetical protein [Leptospira interrogans serovar Yeoncheon]MBE0305724.1 hypothetical protein [Leptospira interrogans serovar Yeoncheon]